MWQDWKEGGKQILTLMLMRGAAAGKCVSKVTGAPWDPGSRVRWKEGRADPGPSSHRL